MQVYLDLVWLLNFAVNFCLLRAAAVLTAARFQPWRLPAAAALGAFYGAACLLPGFGFLGGSLWRLVFLGLMTAGAFGLDRGLLRRGAVMGVLSLALGGAAVCLSLRSFPALALLGLSLAALCRWYLRGAMDHAGQLVPASIALGEKRLDLSALRDSGNTLRDPFSGESVLLVSGERGRELLGEVNFHDPAGAVEVLSARAPGLRTRLIPYRTASGPGLLLAVRCDSVTVAGKEAAHFVAFSPEKLSGDGEYDALTGGGLYG